MFRKKNKEDMMVEEYQYRAVISYIQNKQKWGASVQRRIGINEWEKVRCGLKGLTFDSKEQAEGLAKHKIRLQKALDKADSNPVSYIIYDG